MLLWTREWIQKWMRLDATWQFGAGHADDLLQSTAEDRGFPLVIVFCTSNCAALSRYIQWCQQVPAPPVETSDTLFMQVNATCLCRVRYALCTGS